MQSSENLNATFNTALSALERVIDHIDAFIYVTDVKTCRVIYMNKALARERGIKSLEFEEIFCRNVFRRSADTPCDKCSYDSLIENGLPTDNVLRTEIQSSITGKWYLLSVSAAKWITGDTALIKCATEITERKLTEDSLVKSVYTDSMTGVYNREWGYKNLDKLISDVIEHDGVSSVVFVDIDGLKAVNDKYGHGEGDIVIIRAIEAIKKATRKNDNIFRWGGDEFVVLLPACSRQNAVAVMNNAISHLDDLNKISVKPYTYSFSFGITEINGSLTDTSVEMIISKTDALMHEQKSKKRA